MPIRQTGFRAPTLAASHSDRDEGFSSLSFRQTLLFALHLTFTIIHHRQTSFHLIQRASPSSQTHLVLYRDCHGQRPAAAVTVRTGHAAAASTTNLSTQPCDAFPGPTTIYG